MQLSGGSAFFNKKHVESLLRRENKYITELLDMLPLPAAPPEPENVLLEDSENTETKRTLPVLPNKTKASRAKSLVELQKRLDEISTRKKLSYKEKLIKKNLKTRIKRKGKQSERNATHKQERLKKEVEDQMEVKQQDSNKEDTPSNSQTNQDEKMFFSKFDFSNIGKKKFKKEKHDPKKMLEELQKRKVKVDKLADSGEVEKAAEIKEKAAWKNALAKAQGEKVKDDIGLLSKSIKKT
ncbi:hypothetical protein ILUMI_26736 [Ignelater luminosus]|uniref:Ribosomal RNA-processing protein 14/surfeit locus protein 6 C-terminal domain-containing protein n=1 Tax=Ignelater luminosus TaxID=2038154 RepID=A0A8K0FYD9_IGNLU|nr:hypothetical protein ILUMI_26736 [Ignelater luminosus]